VQTRQKTRIAINGRFLSRSTTGVERYSREILEQLDALAGRRSDLDIVLYAPPLGDRRPELCNIRVVEKGILRGHAWEQVELPLLSRGRILFCPANTAPLLSLWGGQPVVACVHDLSYRYFTNAYRWRFRAAYNVIVPSILRRADAVITVSESERRAILDYFPRVAPRLVAIQNGGAPAAAATAIASSPKPEAPYVLYVGSLSKRKNIDTIMEVATRLARRFGTRFVAIGGTAGGLSPFDWQPPADVAHLIEFVGQLDDTDRLMDYYRGASCFLFPSFYESSPLPPIEAMACGCPVVASATPALMERCGDAALYCNPSNPDDVEAQVVRVLTDKNLAARLRTAGFTQASHYGWDKAAQQTLDVIERVVGRAVVVPAAAPKAIAASKAERPSP